MERPFEITIGGNIIQGNQLIGPAPVAGATDCLIPQAQNRDLVIDQRGVSFKKSTEIQVLAGGGFRLLGGDQFGDTDVWFAFPAGVMTAAESGGYTNGFNLPRIMSALFGRVGWKASTIEGAPVLDVNNTMSRSGRYFNDFHSLNTVHIVKKVMEDNLADDATFNAFVNGLQRGAIMQALNGVLNEPEQLELGMDFDREFETNDRPIPNEGQFVGRRITLGRLWDVANQVDCIGLYFDTTVTFTLYLFQEGRQAPIWSQQVNAIANEKTIVQLPDLILSYIGSAALGGRFYLGYFQDDLGAAKAYDESRYGLKDACNWNIELIQSRRVGGLNFDRKLIAGSPWSHGLNIQLSAFRDWTTKIIKKANLFDELIGLQMTTRIIEMALNNVRMNSEERILKDQLIQLGLFQQMDGVAPGVPDAPKIEGIKSRITREVNRVKKNFYPAFKAINYPSDDCGN